MQSQILAQAKIGSVQERTNFHCAFVKALTHYPKAAQFIAYFTFIN